jgi:hypothetical protein
VRRFATLAIILVGLVVGVTSAEAAPSNPTVSTFPVNFVVSSATCPYLPAGTTVTGSGMERSITTVMTDGNNVVTNLNVTHAQGIATDQAGNKYIFSYTNHYGLSNTVADPEVYSGLMTDVFTLDGNGPARLHNGFVANLSTKIDLSYVFSWNVRSAFGDPISFEAGPFVAHCDPL